MNYRQGELIFVKLENVPDFVDAEIAKNLVQSNVIREGELTGHKHVIDSGKLFLGVRSKIWDHGLEYEIIMGSYTFPGGTGGVLESEKNRGIIVSHPEHKNLKLPAGKYAIIIQREYDEHKNRFLSD
jgi:hypothetical protein